MDHERGSVGSERHGRLARGDEDPNLPHLVTTLLEVQPPCQMGFNISEPLHGEMRVWEEKNRPGRK